MMMMMICRAGPVIDVGGSDVVRFSDSLAFGASGLGNLTCDDGNENDDDDGVHQLQQMMRLETDFKTLRNCSESV